MRKLAYSDGTLISVGFEYEAVVWDLVSKESLFTLAGHKSGIIDVVMFPSTIDNPVLAVTLDETGELKVWNVNHSLTAKAVPIQSFNATVNEQVSH